MTRVIVHIGMNKAGSTAIQKFFTTNFTAARRLGVLFSKTGRTEGEKHLHLSDALGFQMNPRSGPAGRDELKRLRADLDAEIARSQAHTTVISSEHFSRRRQVKSVAKFLSGYDVRILVYLRRHDHWMASRYSQAVKTADNPPWEKGIEAFIRYHRGRGGKGVHESYRRLVDAWAEAFGPDSMLIRPYEPEQNIPNLVTDMLDTIGAGPEIKALHTSDIRYNPAISADGLALIEDIRRSDLAEQVKRRRIDEIIRKDSKIDAGPRGVGMIGPDFRRRLVEENLDEYSYIARHYLGRENGRLFFEPLPKAEKEG